MDDRRCIFCGGMLLDNICVNCGFECLSEEEIAAPYDFEPGNDVYGETENDKTYGMEGISLENLDGSVSSDNIVPAAAVQKPKAVPPVKNVQTVKNNQTVYTPPPAPMQSNPSVFEMIVKDFSTYIQKNWWQLLLLIIAPTTGFFIGAFHIAKIKNGGTASDVVIGVMYIIAAAALKFGGLDLFGLDALLDSLLEALPRRRHRYRYY